MNGSTDTAAHDHTARIARTVWFCAFVLPLVLASLLLGVKTAQADPALAEPAPASFEEEVEIVEEDEGELAETECEIAMEEAEEGEITKAEAETLCKEAREMAKESTATECPIHSATAHASTHHDQLKLTIGYTTSTPVTATIEIHGIGTFKRHLGKSGVLRFTGEEQGRPIVHIKLPKGSAGCPSRRLVLFPG